jgi:hypothetical protein
LENQDGVLDSLKIDIYSICVHLDVVHLLKRVLQIFEVFVEVIFDTDPLDVGKLELKVF